MVFGAVADWYGRKSAFQIYTLITLALSIANYFANDPYTWLVLRFFCGISFLSMSTAKNVWQVEVTSGVWRSRMQHWGHEIILQFGILMLGGLVYLLPDLKAMEIVFIWSVVPCIALSYAIGMYQFSCLKSRVHNRRH